ncbi:probable E3 ubiquitin-protein ligase RHC1A [Lolium rigidum]|uniref:probable E3 ubiquitin-protein ligase RHC1A n=1 Tax=Lolium rigidum TaxID=89674 RepID=UPI001F5E0326|nr:probable E3 ubiquitin-protein ligase RHC1A [Lolium rigidum]
MSNRATHWCYACRRPIRLRGQDIICPNCNDGFIQEISETGGALNSYGIFGPRFDDRQDRRFGMMEAMSAVLRQRMAEMGSNPVFDPSAAGVSAERGRQPSLGPRLIFGSNMPAHPSESSGVNIRVRGGRRIGADRPNFSGFLASPSIEAMFEQLLLQTSNRQGPPPAPQSAIDSMPVVKISRRHLSDDPHCPVCTDKFEVGSEVREMPCKHLYHGSCIIPWLLQHNSCPVCRHPLPPQRGSDDAPIRSPSVRTSETPSRAVTGADVRPVVTVRDDDDGSNSFSFLWPFGSSSPSPSSYQYEGAVGGEPAVFDEDPSQITYCEWHYDP